MVDKATLLDVLIFVARMVLYTVVIVVVVLAVDVVVLWLLNLLTDVDTWLTLLFYESVIMMILGAGSWWRGERPIPWSTPMGKRLYKIKVRSRYPWFWVSLGMGGVMLLIISTYLATMFYGI